MTTRPARGLIGGLIVVSIAGCAAGTSATPRVPSSPLPSAAVASAQAPSPTPSRAPSTAPSATATVAPAATLASTTEIARSAPPDAIAIEMTPDALTPRFKPDTVTAKAGTVTFFLTALPISGTFGPHHDMVIGPQIGTPLAASGVVQPGTSAAFTVHDLPAGTYRFWCTTNTGHGPHQALGMVGTLTVK